MKAQTRHQTPERLSKCGFGSVSHHNKYLIYLATCTSFPSCSCKVMQCWWCVVGTTKSTYLSEDCKMKKKIKEFSRIFIYCMCLGESFSHFTYCRVEYIFNLNIFFVHLRGWGCCCANEGWWVSLKFQNWKYKVLA